MGHSDPDHELDDSQRKLVVLDRLWLEVENYNQTQSPVALVLVLHSNRVLQVLPIPNAIFLQRQFYIRPFLKGKQ